MYTWDEERDWKLAGILIRSMDIVPRSSDYEWIVRASYTNSIGGRIESSISFALLKIIRIAQSRW